MALSMRPKRSGLQPERDELHLVGEQDPPVFGPTIEELAKLAGEALWVSHTVCDVRRRVHAPVERAPVEPLAVVERHLSRLGKTSANAIDGRLRSLERSVLVTAFAEQRLVGVHRGRRCAQVPE